MITLSIIAGVSILIAYLVCRLLRADIPADSFMIDRSEWMK